MGNLYVMIGIPGSGKSTFCKKFIENNETIKWISRDEIRFSMLKPKDDYFSKEDEVYEEYIRQINNALEDGFDVIADASQVSYNSRKKLLRRIDKDNIDKLIAVYKKNDLTECIRRNDAREGRACVPHEVIRQMYGSLMLPGEMEGFNQLWIVIDEKNIILEKGIK